jgi:hypothetical protein
MNRNEFRYLIFTLSLLRRQLRAPALRITRRIVRAITKMGMRLFCLLFFPRKRLRSKLLFFDTKTNSWLTSYFLFYFLFIVIFVSLRCFASKREMNSLSCSSVIRDLSCPFCAR